MRATRTPLTPELSSRWASSAQYRFLDALMSDSRLAYQQIAFHGGTSLHFSWRSPRLSEDLDFLISKHTTELRDIIERAREATAQAFQADDPGFVVDITDKTKNQDRMIAYRLVVSHPAYLGQTMIKVEFWKVDPEYLAHYPVEMRSPIQTGDLVSRISNPVPAAALMTAYCDKLTAFATRPFLKWRDIYDLWWIGTQTDTQLDVSGVVAQFLHNVTAYQTVDRLPPAQALRKFLENDPAELLKKADPDLRLWLPDALWTKLHPHVTAEMVQYVRHALESVANAIENSALDVSLKRVRP